MNLFSILLAANLLLTTPQTKNDTRSGDTLSICFVGDVLLDRGVRKLVEQRARRLNIEDTSKAADILFNKQTTQLLKQHSIVVANLECPATDIHQPVFKRFIFRGEPTWLNTLRRKGITHLNLANNHSIDQGRQGLVSTIDNIKKAGMIPVGAGRNNREASKTILLAKKPRNTYLITSAQMPLENIPFLPDKPSISQMTIETICRKTQRIKKKQPNAVVIISLHWGAEHQTTPSPQQRMQAHKLIDSGADVIIGHHTHTLQTIENYHNKPIFYSIGNFIFDQTRPVNTKAAIAQLKISNHSVNSTYTPIEIKNCTPVIQHDLTTRQYLR